ncbi:MULTISPECIES: DUF305 domain-containing protein [unclassified Microbacterium]|uniref:DUF305 domain-containing protein n=1 Tax=unclassified Microbacterium TaxID=2609290 RepID=UPI00214B0D9C|nr:MULTISPECIES: DUF305 domain-containing protein [unclassified Microbacterium]MCR2810343.1 DUF305 domain-containing protein [Microbacterium sp. zg.B185]WIM18401.1 DUF305 domain-containing protein [Microbacterium sp. zg-B185]
MTDDASTARAPRRWLLVVLACLAIGGLAFAIGRFSAFGTSATTPATDSAEAGFARDMQVHHAQAVEMAMQIYRTTEDTELRTLAYDIATGQSAQRGEMFDWLVQWGLPQAGEPLMSWMADADGGHSGHGGTGSEPLSEAELSAGMGMATDAQLAQLRTASGTEADCLFLELMIRHHEGAIPMAEAILQRGSVPRVLTVATSMKNGQTAEIDAMQSIQRRLGCTG